MTSLNVTDARKQLYGLVDEINMSHEPLLIRGKRHNAILISEDDWRSIQETLFLTAIPGMADSIKAGRDTPIQECERKLDW